MEGFVWRGYRDFEWGNYRVLLELQGFVKRVTGFMVDYKVLFGRIIVFSFLGGYRDLCGGKQDLWWITGFCLKG